MGKPIVRLKVGPLALIEKLEVENLGFNNKAPFRTISLIIY